MPETPGPSEFGLTHAGCVVFRRAGNTLQYLLVSAKGNPDHWVLPKGHIQQGETPEAAATREVYEETGVVARLIGLAADNIRFLAKGEEVTAWFYLMEFVNETRSAENRGRTLVPLEEALKRLRYEETKEAIKTAESMRSARFG